METTPQRTPEEVKVYRCILWYHNQTRAQPQLKTGIFADKKLDSSLGVLCSQGVIERFHPNKEDLNFLMYRPCLDKK